MIATPDRALAPFEVKETNPKRRRFGGMASVFDGVDYQGDMIAPGAYRDSIAAHEKSGEPIYLIDQHRYDSIRRVLGVAKSLKETKEGLEAEFEVVDSPDGAELMARISAGMIRALSIGYMAVEHEPVTVEDRKVRLLKKIDLREISAVIWPADPNALITPPGGKRTRRVAVQGWTADPAAARRRAVREELERRYADTVGSQEQIRRDEIRRGEMRREILIRSLELSL